MDENSRTKVAQLPERTIGDGRYTLAYPVAYVIARMRGLMQFTLGFAVLLLYGVIQTVPRSLEEAAQVHGAGRWRVLWRILLPLSVPGLAIGGLMIFNMCMGAFTSAALLGGGLILTLPVLTERTGGAGASGAATLAIRPERLSLAFGGDIPSRLDRIRGAVVSQMFHGNFRHLKVEVPGALWTVELRPGEPPISDGDHVMLTWSPEQAVVLSV